MSALARYTSAIARLLSRAPIALAAVAVLAVAVLLPGLNTPGLWEPQERQLADKLAPRLLPDGRDPNAPNDAASPNDKSDKPIDAPAPPPAPAGGQAGGVPTAGVPTAGVPTAGVPTAGVPASAGAGAPVPPPAAKPERPEHPDKADRGDRPEKIAKKLAPGTTTPDDATCLKVAPKDALARSLTGRAAAWGRDHVDDTDGGRRFPLALLGILTVIAIAGIAMRTAGPRAGVIAALIALSFPLLVLQARQLTSEIGVAAGASLIIYGLISLGRDRGVLGLASDALSLIALVAGLAIAFLAGGALLGLVVPIGAFATAGALGAPAVCAAGRLVVDGLRSLRTRDRLWQHREAGGRVAREPGELLGGVKALIATLALIVLIGVLAYQMYSIHAPIAGGRQIFGHTIAPSGCWSSALGGTWRVDDDIRITYDSAFEQIAYGTFPWGVLAPIAMLALLTSADRSRRQLGALSLAWAGGAWIATEAFQRKVGFSIYAGFPAFAIAIGVWVDDLFAGRARGDRDATPRGILLIALFAGLAILDLGKDVQQFGERLTSLLVGSDAIVYPTQSHLLLLPTKLWVFVLGMIVGLGVALTFGLWHPDDDARSSRRKVARAGLGAAIGGTVVLAAFWSFGWQPTLSKNLSSKSIFDVVTKLRAPGDELVLMGDLDAAARDYIGSDYIKIVTRAEVMTALARTHRVFAIAPGTELCSIHHDAAGKKPYFVLDDSNVRLDPTGHVNGGEIVLSNRVDGARDQSALAQEIVFQEPTNIETRPKGRIVYDNKLQLIGWNIPKSVSRGSHFEITLFWKVLTPPGGVWQNFTHFDGGGLRFNGDHFPLATNCGAGACASLCATSTWQKNDYIVDTYTAIAGGPTFPLGPYDVWTGFFTGTNPNWKNMPVSEAPGDMRDNADRVKITTINVD